MIKWRKLITKELESEGGSMKLKELRAASVAEANAHPSYGSRDKKELGAEFDREFPTFKKFKVEGNRVTIVATG